MDENNISSNLNVEPVANVEPQSTEPVNTEPVNSEPVGTANPQQEPVKQVQSPQENARYAEIRRKAESEARDKVISEMYGQSHNIHTYADYQKAVKSQQEQDEISKMVQSNVPEDMAKEIVESKKFRQEYTEQQKQYQLQQKQQEDYKNFIETYPGVKPETIPPEVWQEVNSGKSLVDAYAKAENKILKAKIAEYEKGKLAQETNKVNAQTSPGSVTGNGSNAADFISLDTFEANKSDQRWIIKNLEKINVSRPKW